MTARNERGIIRDKFSFERDYVQIPNAWLRNKKLSLKARGLLALLMTHDASFEVSLQTLINSGPEGRDAIEAALRELRAAGHVELERFRDRGKFSASRYRLVDPASRGSSPLPGYPGLVVTTPGSTTPGKPGSGPSIKNTNLLKNTTTAADQGDHSTRGDESDDAGEVARTYAESALIWEQGLAAKQTNHEPARPHVPPKPPCPKHKRMPCAYRDHVCVECEGIEPLEGPTHPSRQPADENDREWMLAEWDAKEAS